MVAAAPQAQLPWVDRKRYLWLLSPVIPVTLLGALALVQFAHWGAFSFYSVALIYVVFPALDRVFGEDRSNAPETAVQTLENDRFYRAVVFMYLPVQYAITIWGTWLAVSGNLAWWEIVGLILTVGAANGGGINAAHELGHKKETLERRLAGLALAPAAYGHFYVEHNRGHHRNVATPEDPASSKMGETYWQFLPRSIVEGAKSAWKIERERLVKIGRPPWSWDNDVLQSGVLTVLLFGALTVWLGWAALLFLVAQALYGISLLESVNYIEHYGLLRQKDANGRYERCTPAHSWNSNYLVTNLVLYHLQRHSDHHANPTRRFQALRHFDESPQLPSGYGSLIGLAYFPALWFRLMDSRVVRRYDGDISLANLYPPKRAALLSLWPAGDG